ncbi:hypothetical protein BLGI_4100 [Brevibacillus laterosporus GI-9]|nr:hypothetical protein BLGI_4100 [Brevibacillus laterosporus GI-9]
MPIHMVDFPQSYHSILLLFLFDLIYSTNSLSYFSISLRISQNNETNCLLHIKILRIYYGVNELQPLQT